MPKIQSVVRQPGAERERPAGRQRKGPLPGVLLFGRRYPLPRSRRWRIAFGVALVFGGILGFLPVLGFWMVPLGLLVLSYEFGPLRRLRRRFVVWRERRRAFRAAGR